MVLDVIRTQSPPKLKIGENTNFATSVFALLF